MRGIVLLVALTLAPLAAQGDFSRRVVHVQRLIAQSPQGPGSLRCDVIAGARVRVRSGTGVPLAPWGRIR